MSVVIFCPPSKVLCVRLNLPQFLSKLFSLRTFSRCIPVTPQIYSVFKQPGRNQLIVPGFFVLRRPKNHLPPGKFLCTHFRLRPDSSCPFLIPGFKRSPYFCSSRRRSITCELMTHLSFYWSVFPPYIRAENFSKQVVLSLTFCGTISTFCSSF